MRRRASLEISALSQRRCDDAAMFITHESGTAAVLGSSRTRSTPPARASPPSPSSSCRAVGRLALRVDRAVVPVRRRMATVRLLRRRDVLALDGSCGAARRRGGSVEGAREGRRHERERGWGGGHTVLGVAEVLVVARAEALVGLHLAVDEPEGVDVALRGAGKVGVSCGRSDAERRERTHRDVAEDRQEDGDPEVG